MSNALKITFLLYGIVTLVVGLPLLIFPGQIWEVLVWLHIDPILSRLFGAALLAMSWSSFRGWQAKERVQVKILLELEAVFAVLGSLGIIRHLVVAVYPPIVWITLVVLVVFAVAWIVFLLKK